MVGKCEFDTVCGTMPVFAPTFTLDYDIHELLARPHVPTVAVIPHRLTAGPLGPSLPP
jgi:hypothetical protein